MQQFDICDLYRGNPWGLQPLNASCDGTGAPSGGGGLFRAENQFPSEGFLGPSGAAAWGLTRGEPYLTNNSGGLVFPIRGVAPATVSGRQSGAIDWPVIVLLGLIAFVIFD